VDKLLTGTPQRLWLEFASYIFRGVDVPPESVQYQEMRGAFLSGMLACFDFLTGPAVTGKSDWAGERILAQLRNDLKRDLERFIADKMRRLQEEERRRGINPARQN
jgi:hypothetical protein